MIKVLALKSLKDHNYYIEQTTRRNEMYKNGELENVMIKFEKRLMKMPTLTSANIERAEISEIALEDGRIAKRFTQNCYYADAKVNNVFIGFLWGYSLCKTEQSN